MIRAKRVLEAGVTGARIYEKGQAQLPHVPQPLERRRVDEAQREGLDPDVVPERVADDLHFVRVGDESRMA
ncbi:hypothetical protein D3C83_145460 [compost metagenome]